MKKAALFTVTALLVLLAALFSLTYPVPKETLYYTSNTLAALTGLLIYLSFGRKILKAAGFKGGLGEIYPLSFAVSFVFTGTIMFLAGALKGYGFYLPYVIALGMALVSLAEIREILTEAHRLLSTAKNNTYSMKQAAFGIILAVTGGYFLITASTPAVYYDSLVYHLGCASQYIERGGIVNMPYNIFSYFPQLATMNYLFFLLLSSELSVKLFIFISAVMTLCAVYALTAKLKGSGRTALLLTLTSPLFFLAATRAGTELYLVFFTILLFMVLLGEEHIGTDRAIIAAVLAGGLISVKYNAVIIYGFFLLLAVRMYLKKRMKLKGLPAFAVIPAAVVTPYLIRNYIYTGDPVYPFLTAWFNVPAGLARDASSYVAHVAGFGPGKGLPDLLSSLWTTVFNRELYGGDIMSPVMAAALILAVFSGIKRIWPLTVFIIVYYISWFYSGQVLRFLLPAEATAMILAGVIYSGVKSNAKVWAAAAFITVQALTCVYFAERYLEPFSLFTGSRGAYIASKADYYPAAEFLNNHRKEGKTALILGDARMFYYKLPVTAYTVFNHRAVLDDFDFAAQEQFIAGLKKRRVGYVVINNSEMEKLKDGGYKDVYAAVKSPKFNNIMDKYFKRIYSDRNCEVFEEK
ncbi:MAG: hypothetical protein LLG37_09365 [Spirochaetia bacterium]|nr:hypothetical protein [Spirochaetia bacterium]